MSVYETEDEGSNPSGSAKLHSDNSKLHTELFSFRKIDVMKRPESVTEKDIQKWANNIDNDPKMKQLPSWTLKSEGFREVCYAGLWLAETLDERGADPELIRRIQFTVGRMCFGRDPWDVSRFVLKAYEDGELDEAPEPEDASSDSE